MKQIYKHTLELKESQLRNTVWYSLGSLCSSATSMILLLLVTRIMGQTIAGEFSLAWSAAQLMLTIGCFSTRQYQVSDVSGKIGFHEYQMAKILSSILMVVVAFLYVNIYEYSARTKIITILLCILLISDVFADFFSGFFQCNGKLHIGGKSYVVRNVGYVIVFCITLILWKNILLSIAVTIIFVTMWLFMFDYQLARKIQKNSKPIKRENVFHIFKECAPLFIGSFLTSYIMNIPKNAINVYMNNTVQASYNILFMPTAVINMFNLFVCVPLYGKIASLWHEHKTNEFLKMIYKIIGIVFCMTVGVLVLGFYWGIPVLSWLYDVSLQKYRLAFMVLILGGGFNGVISVLTYVITVFRKQTLILYVYIICAIVAQLFVGTLVNGFGVLGATITYTLTLAIVCLVFMIYIIYYLKQVNKRKN